MQDEGELKVRRESKQTPRMMWEGATANGREACELNDPRGDMRAEFEEGLRYYHYVVDVSF